MGSLPTVEQLVAALGLQPHPEGGFYAETYRDSGAVAGDALPVAYGGGRRSFSTAIFFLLPAGHVSRLHRISSAEVWHFYLGAPLTVVELAGDTVTRTVLGSDVLGGQRLQHVVPGGTWFGCHPGLPTILGCPRLSSVGEPGCYSLVGCTVSPGFEFADFELAERARLLRDFPHAAEDIVRLTSSER